MQFNPSSEKKTAAFTIIAKNYLPFARVLMESIREGAPGLRRIVILVDRPDAYFEPEKEDFEIILSEDLPIPLLRWFHFKYTILELSTAVKPYAAQEIFERYRVETLLYFDPDIKVYGGLEPVLSALERHSIVITPHLTAPLEDERRPSDLDILRSGSYNLGFIGLRNCSETNRFIQWWQKRLYDHCVVDLAAGLFVDQRWIDLVPGMFDGVGILRDPGLNVAYWNVAHRPIDKTPGGYLAAGRPLCFFHFSGFDPNNPHAFSRHQDRFTLDELGDARELVLEYREKLMEAGYSKCKSWPYAYGMFANGLPIPEIGRPAHHEAPELVSRLTDPFSDEGYQAFLDLWNKPLAGPDGVPTGVTRLAYRIYRSRADVQAVMPDIFNGSLLRFMNWVVSSAKLEHNLSDAFVAPIWEEILRREASSPASASDLASSQDPINEKIIQTLSQSGIWVNGSAPVQLDALNELIGNGDAKLHLSQLAKAIYESRPDLQRFFPDPCGQDGIRFISWFLTYGAREYRLAEVFLSPLRLQWDTVLNSLNNPLKRLWYRLVYASMTSSAATRARLNSVVGRIRLTRTLAAMKLPAARKRSLDTNADRAIATVASDTLPARPFGINFVGYARSEMGVGESVRCAVRAARSSNIRISVKTVDGAGPYRLQDESIGKEDSEWPYSVNVFHVNADQSAPVLLRLGESFTRGRYNVGFWAWELEEFPDKWLGAFQLLDEIWTPSTFCQTAISRKSSIPVVRMPHPILLEECSPMDRTSFGIAPADFVFLAIFDLLSVSERKNPLGILTAFRAAFGTSSNTRLILKINHAEHRPAEMTRIREAASGMAVTIIDRTMDRSHVTGLIQMSDCLVSLHRSEGFGFTMAEAMYLAKPVIATAYSGNLDFTTADNSFLVGYDLVPVPPGCEPYDPGILWAEPRIGDAVCQMRLVASDPEIRCARGRAGQGYIQKHFSSEAVGRLMMDRLSVIQRILRAPRHVSESVIEIEKHAASAGS